MKFLFLLLFLLLNNQAYSAVKVTDCDKIVKKKDKIECLTKLKADAIKEGSKVKLSLIQEKLGIVHKKIGESVEKTEKTVASTGKKIGKKKRDSERSIKDGAKKLYKNIKSLTN